ncbi:MAG: ParB/RepB/Spo0J family partition protein [Clostridiales bacterium]|nr:ParB/RepB/Spo0J family partition protein [Clostridiales bacterium]
MKPNRGLGKGLSALFSETEEDYGKSLLFDEEPVKETKENVTEIEISSIFANPNQPRKVFDQTALNELAASIAKHGVIMPIIVNKSGDRYMIIAGERRFRASKIAGLEKVPVIIKNYNERQIKEISLIENLQREDLNPIEAATAMRSLMDDYGMTQEELADRIGKSRPAIANTLRLLNLSQEVIKLVANGALSAGHARTLISLPQTEQVKVAEEAIKGGLSVRDVEKKVKEYFAPPEEKAKKKAKQELSAELKELIVDMQRVFGTRVNAIGNDKKGRIYIDYYTRDDLDRLSDILEFVKSNKKQ